MWIPRTVWEHLKATMNGLQERNDRLTEALARENGAKALVLPQPERKFIPPQALERSPGYFDTKPIPVVTTNKPGGTRSEN
jgi:hypothetical protein